MKAISNFNDVQASNGGSFELLAPGAYVCKIHYVSDHTDETKPYLGIVYNVYSKDKKAFLYDDDLKDKENYWRHEFRYYVGSDFGLQRYKALIEAVEGTKENGSYTYQNTDGAEQTLVNKWVGFVIRHRVYIGKNGTERTALDLAGAITCDDAINGNFPQEWLNDLDQREKVAKVKAPDMPQPAPQFPQGFPQPTYEFASEDIPF